MDTVTISNLIKQLSVFVTPGHPKFSFIQLVVATLEDQSTEIKGLKAEIDFLRLKAVIADMPMSEIEAYLQKKIKAQAALIKQCKEELEYFDTGKLRHGMAWHLKLLAAIEAHERGE